MSDAKYEAKKSRKIAFYEQNGYDLLQISGDEVKNLDDVLSQKIGKCSRN